MRIVALGRNEEDARKRFADYWDLPTFYFYPAGCQRYAGTAGGIVGGLYASWSEQYPSDGLRLRSGGNHDDKFVWDKTSSGCGSAESLCQGVIFSPGGSVRGEQGEM